MNTINKNEYYASFLEAINKAKDVEALFEDTFEIICKLFNTNKVQLWEKSLNPNEMSISFEFTEGKEASMLKYRVSNLESSIKKTIEKVNIWEYINISDRVLNKQNICSLIGIEFILSQEDKKILVLTFKEKDKKLSIDEIKFLAKLATILQEAVLKREIYEKSLSESQRLKEQNMQLREQDRLRTNFINNISHELRTPLASIIGFSKILIIKNPPSETIKEISAQIHQAANRLSTLVTDFLQINKLDTESWLANFEACDIGELIKLSTEEFSSLNKNHKITYHISDNYPIIKTDPKLVRQVIDNLLSNAIKYSPNGGKIIISLDFLPQEKELNLSITDQGIGIDKDEISKIFNRFYRSSKKEVQNLTGSGLGLSICKEIITTLNGEIKVESEVGKGSKFSFTLPVN